MRPGKASKGDPKFTSTVDGQTYQLTNAMVKDMFDKEPAKYTPSYQSRHLRVGRQPVGRLPGSTSLR